MCGAIRARKIPSDILNLRNWKPMLGTIKRFVRQVPVVGPVLVHLRGAPCDFRSSSDYWDRRYRAGGNSGAGSYNRLAEFKASFLNGFVNERQIHSVLEYGCGDGAQLKLAHYPNYTGVDVSAKAIEMCRTLFGADPSKRFLQSDQMPPGIVSDMSLSLDVVYHLVEDYVFDSYMEQLFTSARRFVIVYSSNVDQDSPARHIRHRQFTRWVERNKPEWRLISVVKNAWPYDEGDPQHTSFADFHVFARGIE
jgi:hypothetical protein